MRNDGTDWNKSIVECRKYLINVAEYLNNVARRRARVDRFFDIDTAILPRGFFGDFFCCEFREDSFRLNRYF